MFDCGEDEDWFGLNFICIFVVLFVFGLIGVMLWLLCMKKLVVDLLCLCDCNFVFGCVMIVMFVVVLYGSVVIVL